MGRTIDPDNKNPQQSNTSSDAAAERDVLSGNGNLHKLLIEATPNLVIVVQDGQFVYINPAGAAILGYDNPDDFIGRPVMETINPAYQDIIPERLQSNNENKSTPPLEITIERPDGTSVVLESKTLPIDLDGQTASLIIGVDVTKRKHAENSLRESEGKYLGLLENSPDIIMRFDRKCRFLYVNKSVKKALDIPLSSFMGKTHGELGFPPDICKYWETHITEVFETGLPFESEFEYLHNGKHLFFHWRLIPEFDTSENIQSVLSISRDITEAKRSEERLKNSMETFADIIRSNPSGMFVFQYEAPDRLILVDGNPTAEKLTGVIVNECRGMEFNDIWPKSHSTFRSERFLSVIETGKTFEAENIHHEPDVINDTFIIKVFLLPGQRLCAVFDKICDQKKTELALQQSEERYRTLVESSPDGVYLTDIEGKLLYLSKSAVGMHGYESQDELLGKSTFALLAPEDYERAIKNYRQFLSGHNKKYNDEYTLIRKNGTRFAAEILTAMIPDNEGNPQNFITLARDITEKKQAAEEKEKLFSLVENSNDFIGLATTDGQVSYLNKAGRKLIGLESMEEVRRTTIFDFVAEEHRKKLQTEIIPHLMKNSRWIGQDKLRHFKTNALIDVDITTFYVFSKETNEPTALACVMRDITEKKYLETQLIHSQKMEAIGTLAGGIAHDFNNILAAIIGYTELSLDQVEESSEIFGDLKEVLNSGYRAKELVGQILTFSRKQKETRKPVLVSLIVKEIIKFLRATLPTTIEIKQTISDQQYYVLADPTQIHQVMMNLCTNSAFAMQENGGVLEILLQPVELNHITLKKHPNALPGIHIKLTVKDTGTGMSPKVMSRIYEPYFTTKGIGEGTGLGLSVVHGIVNNYKGFLEVSSKEGKGTVFEVYLPAMDTSSIREDIEIESLPTGRERILFVDDEPNILTVMKRILEKLGYYVTTCESGPDALEIFMAAPDNFDLIITDLTMPKITGDMLAKEFMNIRNDIPVILCTGFNEAMTPEMARDMGMRALLHKPLSVTEIALAVHAVINKKD